MSVIRLSKRYAASLLELASEQGKLDAVFNDMQSLISHAQDNRDLALLLRSPIVSADKKRAALKSLYEGKVEDLTMRFITLTVQKKREVILEEIAAQFVEEYYKSKGIVKATLTTAVEINPQLKDKIRAQVEAQTKKTVEFKELIDDSIIGGYVLEYDNKLLNASVMHQLNEIRKKFSKNEFIKTI